VEENEEEVVVSWMGTSKGSEVNRIAMSRRENGAVREVQEVEKYHRSIPQNPEGQQLRNRT